MRNIIGNDWDEILKDEFDKAYFKEIIVFLEEAYKNKTIFPPKGDIFKALTLSSYEDTKVLILGQDPYYNPGQANGLAFSVKEGVKIPPSLRNIYKELEADLGIPIAGSGSLVSWAKQGVLLLNTSLTVEEKKPNSHKNIGWQIFTDQIIKILNEKERPCVFILWGNNAITKEKFITNPKHLIIKSSHPSPLSARRGFFGSKVFSKTNQFLKDNKEKEINWKIETIDSL
ncbi:uracil-DNA glycosylase [uncultured Anaerococcus sp.]|uniref:uracil-DNA glycosylase n=1 Tax=uncultured Anaerococcus sp. TaxID=293428 RepID=UPI00261272BE|nr:uracil-DNA glycosylase [uncultured Anaerococcus sp.]